MSKKQKIEWVTCIAIVITVILLIYVALSNMKLFDSSLTFSEIILLGLLALEIMVFIINYIFKLIDEKNKVIRLIWIVIPVIAIVFSNVFENGICNFNQEFVFLNRLSILLEIIMILLYNIYFLVFYGKHRRMLVTLITYNTAAIIMSVRKTGIIYVHHYYLAFFLLAIILGYAELICMNKLKLVKKQL